jgi:hypothetical protein
MRLDQLPDNGNGEEKEFLEYGYYWCSTQFHGKELKHPCPRQKEGVS